MNEVKDLKWFEFSQNNSGGYFEVNENVCHRLFIEAEDFIEAKFKAERLGCYWDGVENGIDCPCCGDRWSCFNDDPIDLNKYKNDGYEVYIYDGIYSNTINEWSKRYGKYEIIEQPEFNNEYSTRKYSGRIMFHNIKEYAQYLANEFGWTTPDARIYYNNGTIEEIFSNKLK